MSTGEGSLSPYHVERRYDILYQIGPAKFGCVRLMADSMTRRRPRSWRFLRSGGDRRNPRHPDGRRLPFPQPLRQFDDAPSLLDFVERVRKLTDKPIGLKMVVGSTDEVTALCREMRRRGDGPDFIAVDGHEGGSGARVTMKAQGLHAAITSPHPQIDAERSDRPTKRTTRPT